MGQHRQHPCMHGTTPLDTTPAATDCCRPVYTRQEWDDALQGDGAIAGFDEIVEQIEQRVRGTPQLRQQHSSVCTSCTCKPRPWQDLQNPAGVGTTTHITTTAAALQGIEPYIRADVWPFLLEVFDHASTYSRRQHQHYLMTSQYQQLLLQCQVRTQDQTTAGLMPGSQTQ